MDPENDPLRAEVRQLVQCINNLLTYQSTEHTRLEDRVHIVELTCAGFPNFTKLGERMDEMQKTLSELSTQIGNIRGGNKWIDYIIQIGLTVLISGVVVTFLGNK